MIAIIDQMKELVDNALANGSPCILATVSGAGEPDIGYKGSMMVFDPESLAYWERTKRVHLKNVKENPRVIVLFRDAKTKAASLSARAETRRTPRVMATCLSYWATQQRRGNAPTAFDVDRRC